MKRIAWIDAAKGILIVLVVLGHCHLNEITDVLIGACHMCGFFLLSGITFHADMPFRKFFRKKFFSLIIPYFCFSAIMLVVDFLKTFISPDISFNPLSGLMSIILPISGRSSTTVYGLWFLPCLFLTELAAYGLIKTFKKNKMLSTALVFVVAVFCIGLYMLTDTASVISILPLSLLFLFMGYIFKEAIKKYIGKWYIGLPALVIYLTAAIANWRLTGGGTDLSSMMLGIWPLFILSSIAGAMFICFIAWYSVKIKIFNLLGPDTLCYYGLHYEVLGAVKKIIRGGVLQAIITFCVLYPIILIYKKCRKEWKAKYDKRDCADI